MDKPIRSETEREVAHDPWQGKERPLEQKHTDHILSGGAIVSDTTRRRVACDCGCLGSPGGYCGACGSLTCESCFRHCDLCRAPCCSRHGLLVDTPDSGQLLLCPSCRSEFTRRQLWKRAGRLLLSPFVRFEK